MGQTQKIEKVLKARKTGVTAAQLAERTGVPLDSVYKRIHDLQKVNGVKVLRTRKTVKGRAVTYYSVQ